MRPKTAVRVAALCLGVSVLQAGCASAGDPALAAKRYAQAVYARDFRQTHALLSAEDRKAVGSEESFARQYSQAGGFALEVGKRLAASARMVSAESRVEGDSAEVVLSMQYPDADHPDIFDLLIGRHEPFLNARSEAERKRILGRLDDLLGSGKPPVVDRREVFAAVREGGEWKIVRDYARKGVRIRFRTALSGGMAIEASVFPPEVVVLPGESFFVGVRVRNLTGGRVVSQMDHEIMPAERANYLSLVECLTLVFLKPGETEDLLSEYALPGALPEGARDFDVTYRFAPVQELGPKDETTP